jgi:hypothetical protein
MQWVLKKPGHQLTRRALVLPGFLSMLRSVELYCQNRAGSSCFAVQAATDKGDLKKQAAATAML